MTPTNLVSMSAPSLPSNWYELAIKARTAALRESQQRASALSSAPSETEAQDPRDTTPNLENVATHQNGVIETPTATSPIPVPKTEPVDESLARTETLSTATAEASYPSQLLAGGLVGVSGTNGHEASTHNAITATPTTQQPIIAALASTGTNRGSPLEGDALRTEVMGPPPSLPADPAYPPLNPVIADVQAPAPNTKRRGGSASAINGTQRKPSPPQAPADFIPPTNLNGKMPFALFQTVKKDTPAESSKSPAPAAPAEQVAQVAQATSADSNVVDPLLADVLTDADSVATATGTRETSPEATLAPDSAVSVPVAEADDTTSPTVALRRNPSNRGASLQASQSITSAYADPLGLKKHRESLLQEQNRTRRSPSASSTGAAAAPTPPPASAGGKKSNAARTIVPPPLVEPPPGMMHTPEGRLRTIPGIAGALVPPGPNSTSTDMNLTPRLEDKGAANNDFCEACGGHGRFVCCDGCPRSFHFHCMSPPLDIDEMPPSNAVEVLGPAKTSSMQKGKAKADASGPEINMDEMWFCNVCVAERKPKAAQKPKGLGPFGYLLPLLSQHNPKSFQLPADVRTYFKDVSTANDGDYINGGMVRQVKPNRHGLIETRDPYRLKDKNGDAVLCYRCGGTALPAESENQQQSSSTAGGAGSKVRKAGVNKTRSGSVYGDVAPSTPAEHTVREGTGWRKIVSCDFCPLHWHIDCVDPPMLGMPSNLRKWMCPAHSDHVNDRRRIARVGAAVPRTVDLPLPSARTIGPGKHFRTRVLNNGDIDIIPDPMEELMGANGITGSLQSGIKEIPLVPGVVDAPALTAEGSKLASKIRYRFPEKVIRTDFWTKLRADDSSKIGDLFYVAAEEIAHRAPVRLVAAEDGANAIDDDDSRFRPFGRRQNALSGLDALADIASSRLKADALAGDESVATSFKKPSRTRQLIATALGIELTNDDVPESSVRSSLENLSSAASPLGGSSDSPLSSLSESESDVAPVEASTAASSASQLASEAPKAADAAPVVALSEEELIKRIALEAATGVSIGDPIRLSKRKAAVAAESAIAGSPSTPAKKLRSDSPAVTPTPARSAASASPAVAASAAVSVPVEVRPAGTTSKRITLKSNGAAAKNALTESQVALRTAYHLADQYADERKEIEQLRAIRELMKLKGPARMLEFLLSPNEGGGA
ncbi:hypothetical protein EX895_004297 [Sporisorium graminicola]|uniref:PHD-type domain-containing protein n=1 Tax=Sporisorium graminicola TaxID=280036 RepID=A0A4U7KRS0_9BASI|nr:hypothetical protein EX895_004297 [Sporisorium graminicola]TKY86657.1 hypothetical protein EX895_004297 [Sporisorium graminicola]